MAITQFVTKALAGTFAAGTSGVIGSFNLLSDGPGGSSLDNVTVNVSVRSIEHGSSVTHEHEQTHGMFKRVSGSLVGPIGGSFPEVKNNGDSGGGFSSLTLATNGNAIEVTANAGPGGDTPKSFSAIMHVVVVS